MPRLYALPDSELQVYAIEECVRCAQRGGVGVVVYFRKEGRALGEVTKYAQPRPSPSPTAER